MSERAPRPSCAEGIVWLAQRLADRIAAGQPRPAEPVVEVPAPVGPR